MKRSNKSIFRSISLLISGLILVLAGLFITLTYLATVHYYQATTQRINKDVAAHIAKFASPFDSTGLNRKIADSVFYDAMILSPSVEVYFLDTAGKVMYFHAPDSVIKVWQLPLDHIRQYINSGGLEYIKGPDPKLPGMEKIFSAAEVRHGNRNLGYIYVVLGGNNYQTISQMLFGNHVTSLAIKVSAIVVILSIVVSLFYLNRIKRKLIRITDVMTAFREGNYKARFDSGIFDEFSSLTGSFNTMADLLTHNIERLEMAEMERKNFLANISHDLRTPLTVIRGYVETLQGESNSERLTSEKQEEITVLLHKKIRQMESMIMQLFELSRMESAEFKPAREPFNISEVMEEMTSDLRKPAEKKKIQLSSSGTHEMTWIDADIALMERVIQNLAANAIRHTPQHGWVHIKLEKKEQDILAIFENSSPALPEDLLQWINTNTNTIHKNTDLKARRGLGLAIVKKILQLHGYEIKASNTNGFVRIEIILKAFRSH
ncbi:HAMP domain-containing sensor histidine kinase [Flavitalea flava]